MGVFLLGYQGVLNTAGGYILQAWTAWVLQRSDSVKLDFGACSMEKGIENSQSTLCLSSKSSCFVGSRSAPILILWYSFSSHVSLYYLCICLLWHWFVCCTWPGTTSAFPSSALGIEMPLISWANMALQRLKQEILVQQSVEDKTVLLLKVTKLYKPPLDTEL